ATPVIALVDHIRSGQPEAYRPYVHYGATSQDIVDTAMMLVARRSVAFIDVDLSTISTHLEVLRDAHGATPQRARTLMRGAQPTTFGAICGAWHAAVAAATDSLSRFRAAVQLGGAVGDRSAFGDDGDRVAAAMAARLGLATAPPWH